MISVTGALLQSMKVGMDWNKAPYPIQFSPLDNRLYSRRVFHCVLARVPVRNWLLCPAGEDDFPDYFVHHPLESS